MHHSKGSLTFSGSFPFIIYSWFPGKFLAHLTLSWHSLHRRPKLTQVWLWEPTHLFPRRQRECHSELHVKDRESSGTNCVLVTEYFTWGNPGKCPGGGACHCLSTMIQAFQCLKGKGHWLLLLMLYKKKRSYREGMKNWGPLSSS